MMKLKRTMRINTLEKMCELMCEYPEEYELSEAFNELDEAESNKLASNGFESNLEPPRAIREGDMRGGEADDR